MKTISASVDDETHRLARVRAAETGTTVSEVMRERRARLLEEVLNRFRKEGIGVDTNQLLTREELYDRNAAR